MQKRSKFVSLRGCSAAVAIFKPKAWHPAPKHGAPARRISNILEIKWQVLLQNLPFLCHCEAAARPWQSLSRRYGIPWRSTGARNKKKSLSQKWDSPLHSASSLFIPRLCFIPRNHISFRDDKSFRQRLPRRAHAPSSQ